jgi:hypothetical protein
MSATGPQPAREQLSELALAEWRREVFDMYREVRLDRDLERAHARWRERRDRLFREHSQSPLAVDDPMRETGVPYWPYDPRLRFSVPVVKAARPARRSLPTGGEEHTELRQVGWVELPDALGSRLAVWWLAQYGGGLFVPFRDQTAGSERYGAGRYLLDTAKGATWAWMTVAWSWISTSATTRRAGTTPHGSARSPRPKTCLPARCGPASGCDPSERRAKVRRDVVWCSRKNRIISADESGARESV